MQRAVYAAYQPSESQSPQLFVRDRLSGLEFLVDSGSDPSILPKSFIHQLDIEVSYTLRAANGSPIKTYGLSQLALDFGLSKPYVWNFIVADIDSPIIGADMLKSHHLLPDLTRR